MEYGTIPTPFGQASPEAYLAGYDYGFLYGMRPPKDAPKFAEDYSGAHIEGDPEGADKAIAYSSYCDGYAYGCRARINAEVV